MTACDFPFQRLSFSDPPHPSLSLSLSLPHPKMAPLQIRLILICKFMAFPSAQDLISWINKRGSVCARVYIHDSGASSPPPPPDKFFFKGWNSCNFYTFQPSLKARRVYTFRSHADDNERIQMCARTYFCALCCPSLPACLTHTYTHCYLLERVLYDLDVATLHFLKNVCVRVCVSVSDPPGDSKGSHLSCNETRHTPRESLKPSGLLQ